jgi:hypothetical protein
MNYGYDVSCVSDTGLVDQIVTSPYLVIGQRLARRLQTPRGGLAAVGDDPNFGWDVRQYTNGRLSAGELAKAQQQISAECTKDEEVSAADVAITFVNGGALTITIRLTSAVGPFSLTLNVSQLTVAAVFSQ